MKEIDRISYLGKRVLAGERISFEEAWALIRVSDAGTPFLLGWADAIRKHYRGTKVEICAITNARAGLCSEDCRFCAQAARYRCSTLEYSFLAAEELLSRARKVWDCGIKCFSLVVSGRSPGEDFDRVLEVLYRLRQEFPRLRLCASLGIITPAQARSLKEVGLHRYHHNLETAASFFPEICTTHRYTDRVATIRVAQEAGLQICAGGIIGLGESLRQRVELVFELQSLGVTSVPVNILHPIPGTPLAGQPPLPPLEILRTLAVFRFVLPAAVIRYAGGREHNLRDTQALGLVGGVDGLITGDYLTTRGQEVSRDFGLLRDRQLEQV